MPIRAEVRDEALEYVNKHLFDEAAIRKGFSFINDADLLELIVLELKSARYIYRLMEMLDLKDQFSHPFCKFQIVQYAGIFEAAIDHLIFDRKYINQSLRKKVDETKEKLEMHDVLATVSAFSSKTKLYYGSSDAYVAILKRTKKQRPSIRFESIVNACAELTFVDEKLQEEILEFYKKRNSVHLSARIKNAITVELSDTKRGFRRVNAFCENVKRSFKKHGEPV